MLTISEQGEIRACHNSNGNVKFCARKAVKLLHLGQQSLLSNAL
jgi:hypothetical protein